MPQILKSSLSNYDHSNDGHCGAQQAAQSTLTLFDKASLNRRLAQSEVFAQRLAH
jgi:hypothetical protein